MQLNITSELTNLLNLGVSVYLKEEYVAAKSGAGTLDLFQFTV